MHFRDLLKRCIIDEKTRLPMIVDTRNSAFDFAPIRTTLTLAEIEEKISNKFNKDITAEVNLIVYNIL